MFLCVILFLENLLEKKNVELLISILLKKKEVIGSVIIKKGLNRIYFDSFGQITPIEIQNYLKTNKEKGVAVIQRNTDIVQSINTNICGHLCLFVLKALTSGWSFQEVLNHLNGYSRSNR